MTNSIRGLFNNLKSLLPDDNKYMTLSCTIQNDGNISFSSYISTLADGIESSTPEDLVQLLKDKLSCKEPDDILIEPELTDTPGPGIILEDVLPDLEKLSIIKPVDIFDF